MMLCAKLCQRNRSITARYAPGLFFLGFSFSMKNAHQAIIASQWIETIKNHQYSAKDLTLNQFIKSNILKTQVEKEYEKAKKSDHDMAQFTKTYQELRNQLFIEGKQINKKIFTQTRLTDASQDKQNFQVVFFPTQFSTQHIFNMFADKQIDIADKQYVYYGSAGISKTFSFVLLILLTNYVNYFRYKEENLSKQLGNLISLPRKKFIYGSIQSVSIQKIQDKKHQINTQLKEQFPEMSEKLQDIDDYQKIRSTIMRQFKKKNVQIIPIIDQTNKLLSLKRKFVETYGFRYKHEKRQQVLESIQFKLFLFSFQYFTRYTSFGSKFILNNSEMCQFSLLSNLNSKNKQFVLDFDSRMRMVLQDGHNQFSIIASPFKNHNSTTCQQIFEFFIFQINKYLKKNSIKETFFQNELILPRLNAEKNQKLYQMKEKFRALKMFYFNETFLQIRTYVQQNFLHSNILETQNQIKKNPKEWLQKFIKQYHQKVQNNFTKALQKYWKQGTPQEFQAKLTLHYNITARALKCMKYQDADTEHQIQQKEKAFKDYYHYVENKSIYLLLKEGIYNRTIFRFYVSKDGTSTLKTRIEPIFTPQQYLHYVIPTGRPFILDLLLDGPQDILQKFVFQRICDGKGGLIFEEHFTHSLEQMVVLQFRVKNQNFKFIPSQVDFFYNFLGTEEKWYNLSSKDFQKIFKNPKNQGKCIAYYPKNKTNPNHSPNNPGFDFMYMKYKQDNTIEWNTIDFTTTKSQTPKSKFQKYTNWMEKILRNNLHDKKSNIYLELTINGVNHKIKFIHFIINTRKEHSAQEIQSNVGNFVKGYYLHFTDIDFSKFSINSTNQLFMMKFADYLQENRK